MSNKQSSVEYLIEHLLPKALTVEQYYHIEKAKAMHKEEVEQFTSEYCINYLGKNEKLVNEYYKEVFEGGNNESKN